MPHRSCAAHRSRAAASPSPFLRCCGLNQQAFAHSGILVSYGYRCGLLSYPPYMYDCHCTCAGAYAHSPVVWTTVELRGSYDHPVRSLPNPKSTFRAWVVRMSRRNLIWCARVTAQVVVTSTPTAQDPEHVTVRVRNVLPSSFEIGACTAVQTQSMPQMWTAIQHRGPNHLGGLVASGLQESRCSDRSHGEEQVGWLVVEQGAHNLTNANDSAPVMIQVNQRPLHSCQTCNRVAMLLHVFRS